MSSRTSEEVPASARAEREEINHALSQTSREVKWLFERMEKEIKDA
jgi:hypothetical protein